MLVTVPNASSINIQKVYYHNAQLARLLDSRPGDQAWSTKGPSRFHGVQIKIHSEIPLSMVENFPFHFSNHLGGFS
jgi:hypothetical protein